MFAERAAKNGSERRENRNSFFQNTHTNARGVLDAAEYSRRSFRRVVCCLLLDGRRQSRRRPKTMYSSSEEEDKEEDKEEDAMCVCVCVCVCASTDGVVLCVHRRTQDKEEDKKKN